MRAVRFSQILVAVLGVLPTVALVIACQTGALIPTVAARPEPVAPFPSRMAEAPLLAADAVEDPDAARALNAAVPFVGGRPPAAAPFHFSGTPADYANARDCLALAALAEAGPSDSGQRAVIQVVLNRVRHPAFPRTICATVFEGAERATGCQFTFTCDGGLARRYDELTWDLARRRAEDALHGLVFTPVGSATHYHTDWVYPPWSPELEKIAQVETHLFFRWPGYWGSRAALSKPYRGGEPAFAALLAGASPAAAPVGPSRPALPSGTPRVGGGSVVMRLDSGKASFVEIQRGTNAQGALAMAHLLCGAPGTCRVLGWSEVESIPLALPLSREARASLRFSYTRDPSGAEIVLYDCARFGGVPPGQCIPRSR